jgi:hypothetical protein
MIFWTITLRALICAAMGAAAALVLALTPAPAHAQAQTNPVASVTYTVSQTIGQATVQGQVVTNGRIGTLTQGDILSWNLTLTSGGISINLTTENSRLFFQGNDLVASARELTFNFSGSGGVLTFQKVLFSGREYWCLQSSSGPCFQGGSIVPNDFRDPSAAFTGLSGVVVIGNVAFALPEEALGLSFDQLADARFAQMIDTLTKVQVLLGLNDQITNCGPSLGGFVSFGSFDVATNGRVPLTQDVTLLGGLMAGTASRNGVATPLSAGAALALRYDPAGMGSSRPFAEIGAAGSVKRMRLERRYDTGTGAASGTGEADGYDLVAYARVGWVSSLGKRDEVAVSASLTGMWQGVAAYEEAQSPDNPFPALVPRSTDRLGIAALNVHYTHLFPEILGLPVELGLNGGVQHMFAQKSGVVAQIADLSFAPDRPKITYFQLGGRVSMRVSRLLSAGVFVNATLAPDRIGSAVHGGFGFRTLF